MSAGSRYSDEQRREAVALYVLHGNWRRVSELTSIPQRTLCDWASQPWYGTLVAELRAEKGAELDGAYTRILDEATAQLLDRLKYGDPYVVAGEVRYKPVTARDLALVVAITYDKRSLSRAEAPPPEKTATDEELAAWLQEKGEKVVLEIEAHDRDFRARLKSQQLAGSDAPEFVGSDEQPLGRISNRAPLTQGRRF